MRRPVFSAWMVAAACGAAASAHAAESQCFGTVSLGRIEGSVALPTQGTNFTAYSTLAVWLGRTHVHSRVAGIVTAAYRALAHSRPQTRFVYGETGWPAGGRFRPHRTHQNGLSVDFFVPVKDASGRSVPLPTDFTNKLGYALEFDDQGRLPGLSIDFEALADHLLQLDASARDAGAGLKLVIFDEAYLPRLWATPRGPLLQQRVPFMKGRPWVRHDEHFHVDFAVPCQPLPR